jgi:uncharacterized protein (TIGR03083 family)
MTLGVAVSTPPLTPRDYVNVARASYERLVGLVQRLDFDKLTSPSYDSEWSIGQVLSHLGSQAQIFELLVTAHQAGDAAPGSDVFREIWADWDSRDPLAWRADCLAVNDKALQRFESMTDFEMSTFRVELFRMDLDFIGLMSMRINELATHTWDVDVALNQSATILPAAVGIIADGLPALAGRIGKAQSESYRVRVQAVEPNRDVVISVGESVSIDPVTQGDVHDGVIEMPAEAYVRLVFGRLDPAHTPPVTQSGSRGLDDLRKVFVGL